MDEYQDALLPDGLRQGQRDCAPRWDLIQAHVPNRGVLLDVGSNLGYFGVRAALERPQLAIISLEPDPAIADRQRSILRGHDLARVCLLQGRMTAAVAREWAAACDWLDVTLLLSVLHWLDDPEEVVRRLSSMSTTLIAEVPDAADTDACGRSLLDAWRDDPPAWFERVTGRRAVTLGRAPRHTSSIGAHIVAVTGPVTRRASRPYWGSTFDRPYRESYVLQHDARQTTITIRGEVRVYQPGVNLVTLLHLGRLLHPHRSRWLDWGRTAREASPGHSDPFPHNLIWSSAGLTFIDVDDLDTESRAGDGMESLSSNISAWERNRTVADAAYVKEAFGPRRRLRRLLGRVLRLVLPRRAFDWLRSRV